MVLKNVGNLVGSYHKFVSKANESVSNHTYRDGVGIKVERFFVIGSTVTVWIFRSILIRWIPSEFSENDYKLKRFESFYRYHFQCQTTIFQQFREFIKIWIKCPKICRISVFRHNPLRLTQNKQKNAPNKIYAETFCIGCCPKLN